MTISKVLITGGNGNLGRLVASDFEAHGVEVVAFDLPASVAVENAPAKDRLLVTGDIRDTDLLKEILKVQKPDAILHLASLLSGSSEADPALAWAVNATASINLMHLAKEHTAGPFVFASTIATYAPDNLELLPEDAPQWPENVYGATKVAVERMGVWMKKRDDFDFRCLRFPMVLSPFSPPGAVTAYPGHACNAAVNGEPFTFPVGKDTGMSTLFLNDVTRSLLEITFANRDTLKSHAYNLHAFHFTAGKLATYLKEKFGNAKFSFEPDARVDPLISGWPDRVDDTSARKDWSWEPQYDFEKCVEAVLALAQRIRQPD
ncbi:MAG: NAD-dependent epimerase/dehydratase family protein [Pseudomonadota bacterium]